MRGFDSNEDYRDREFIFPISFLELRSENSCFILFLNSKKSTMRGKFSRPPCIFTISLEFLINTRIGQTTTRTREFAFITDMNLLTPQLRVPRLCNNDTNPRIRKITRFVKINHPLSILISLSPRKKIPNIPKIEGR